MKKIRMACLLATVFTTPIHAEEAESGDKEIIVTGVLANDDTPINPVRLPQSARVSSQTLDAED